MLTRCSKTKKLSAIAYYYPPEVRQTVPASFGVRDQAYATLATGKPEQLSIEFTGLAPGTQICVEMLDQQNGNALAVWETLGRPDNLSREQAQLLREKALATKTVNVAVGANGSFNWQCPMAPWSVVLIRQN